MKTKEECINYILLSINALETNLELIENRNSYKFLSNSTELDYLKSIYEYLTGVTYKEYLLNNLKEKLKKNLE